MDTDQVKDQGELRCAACLQGQRWLPRELLFSQRRDVFDEEIPAKQNKRSKLPFLLLTVTQDLV